MRAGRWLMVLLGVAVLGAWTVSEASAQGRGRMGGYGPRWGNGACVQPGYGMGMGGGWWMRANPQTPEQKSLVARVTELHNEIRAANAELWAMQARKASAKEIAAQQNKITALRAELQRVTQQNEQVIRSLGIPAPYGVCDGTGPKGFGGGRGMGPRGGGGNPYCPFRWK